MATTNKPCEYCDGHKVIEVAAGVQQRCPLCGGTGKALAAGEIYTYELDVALAANAVNTPAQIQLLNYSFLWLFAMATSTGVFSALISDNKANRQFSNQALHRDLFFGTAQLPFPIMKPYRFMPRGVVQFYLNDLSGAPNTVKIALHGLNLDE